MSDSIRADKWLWYARMARSRAVAQKLVAEGRVRINREKASTPSKLVRPGDVLTLNLPGAVRVLRVKSCGERRGPFAEARHLYEDLDLPAVETGTGPDISPDQPRRQEAPACEQQASQQIAPARLHQP